MPTFVDYRVARPLVTAEDVTASAENLTCDETRALIAVLHRRWREQIAERN